MTAKKRRARFSPRAIFSGGTQAQFSRVCAKPAVHIDCAGGLCFENARGIVAYTDTMIQLDMGGVNVRVEGDSLCMTFYRRDRIAVQGRVASLEFLYGGAT